MVKQISAVMGTVLIVLAVATFALWVGWSIRLVDDWRTPAQATGGMFAALVVRGILDGAKNSG